MDKSAKHGRAVSPDAGRAARTTHDSISKEATRRFQPVALRFNLLKHAPRRRNQNIYDFYLVKLFIVAAGGRLCWCCARALDITPTALELYLPRT
jgi:hypothetical protein